jgi:hypothetical protein
MQCNAPGEMPKQTKTAAATVDLTFTMHAVVLVHFQESDGTWGPYMTWTPGA